MLKRLLISLLLVFFFGSSHAQFDTVFAKTNIRLCADSMAMGFKTKNWDQYTRYSYPALIGSMGGKAAFRHHMDTLFRSIPDSVWKKYEPGRILQVIKTAGDLQAVIELNYVLEWQGYRTTTTTYLVGESWDGGLFWTFFNPEGDVTLAKLIKPDLSDQLIIPSKKEKGEPLVPGKKNQ